MSTTTDGRARGRARTRTATSGRTRAPERKRTPDGTRPAPERTSAPQRRPASRAPRMPFVLLVLGLLGGAMISLLTLRTVLIEDAFAITELEQEYRDLSHQEEALREDVIALEAPDRIASEAEAMGMEPGDAPLFIDLRTGTVNGDPEAGTP
ncbi:cell division protein FtsL [Nocardiopsis mwathae]|uniref:Cell division protein FtsL n=1 Tax=Nocardiopsis mwathae TaxID=1472723 RepID=A0A7X0D5I3_9ACTN|nr:hypothetical protein [Nocardiopsis mwathae]MBB6172457.1 cell division protein FtsL [Nocardiopsis mwathae]